VPARCGLGWATDLEAGSRFGYALLWVLLSANLMALVIAAGTAIATAVAGLIVVLNVLLLAEVAGLR
jgi:Mn2+/Fe2+ NRAMP family transporter